MAKRLPDEKRKDSAVSRAPSKQLRRTAAMSSKERIVDAAIAEFAAKGLAGARVDEVARRSGVNKTLLYHHIGNKDQLFTAALEATYQGIRARQRAYLAREMDPEAGVRQLVKMLMSIWVKHPEFGRLLENETFHGGKHVKRSKLIGELYPPLIAALENLLKRGAAAGVFRPNIDPVDLYISISSLSAYYVSHRYTLSALFHVDVMTRTRLQQRENHILDMVMRYVRRRSEGESEITEKSGAALISD